MLPTLLNHTDCVPFFASKRDLLLKVKTAPRAALVSNSINLPFARTGHQLVRYYGQSAFRASEYPFDSTSGSSVHK